MKRQHLLLILGATLVTFGLLLLPKAVVKKAGDAPEAGGQANRDVAREASPATAGAAAPDTIHNRQLTGTAQQRVAALKKQLAANPRQTAWFDSLAVLFANQAMPDSAAIYLAAKADITKSAADQAAAADTYAESAALALTPEKQTAYQTKARALYEKALAQRPTDQDLKVRLAMTWVDSPQPMTAITMLREVLQSEPENRAATFNLGLLSMRSNQYDKAMQRFEKYTQLDPADPKGWYYLGVSQKESGQKDKARATFTKLKTMTSDPQVIASAEENLKELR